MKNPCRVSYLREVVLAALISMLAQPTFASSCYTVKLSNDSSETVSVSWGAQGCAGINTFGATEICSTKTIAAGTTASYGYLWGTTAPTVWLYPPGATASEVLWTNFQYYHVTDNWETFPTNESVPSCNLSWTIHFSDGALYDVTNGKYGSEPASPTNVSVTKTQLPLPSGGTSDCIQIGTEAILLNNNVLNLKWQLDGNLVLYANSSGAAVWASETTPDATHICFQGDGNLVIYRSSHGPWATGTNSNGNELRLQADCNLLIYDANGKALWWTDTQFACN